MFKHLIAAAIAVLAAFPLFAQLVIDFEREAVTARVTPQATTAWIANTLAPGGGGIRMFNLITDADGDGIVRWEHPGGYLPYGTWCVVDMSSGAIHGRARMSDTPPLTPLMANFLRDSAGNYSWVELPEGVDNPVLMWVRPGVGAWAYYGFSNLSTRLVFPVSRMGPLAGPRSAVPAGFEKGDIFVYIGEALIGEFFAGGTVDERLEAAATEPSRITMQPWPSLESNSTARVELRRGGSTNRQATVRYTTADASAVAGVHYEATSGTVTFLPGDISKIIEIPLIDDDAWLDAAGFRFVLSDATGATLQLPRTDIVSIVDDDPVPLLAMGMAEVPEGGPGEHQLQVPVRLTGTRNAPATVHWRARRSDTGSSVEGRLVFAPDVTKQNIVLLYEGNTAPNADLAFEVTARLGSGVQTGQAFVVDDDSLGITPRDITVQESAGNALIPLTLSAASPTPVSVKYSTSSETAWRDYEFTSGTLTFAPGETLKYVSVPIVQELVYEWPENFRIRLHDAADGVVIRRSSAIVTIEDDDTRPPFTTFAVPGREGERYVILAVEAAPGLLESAVPLSFRIIPGSARENTDFEPVGEWKFTLLSSTYYFELPIINDTVPEQPETLSFEIFDPANPEVVLATAETTIEDDDSPLTPTVTISDVTVREGDAFASFDITMSAPWSETVTFRADTVRGTAEPGDDYEPFHILVTLQPGQTSTTIRVPLLEDTRNEVQESFSVWLTRPTNAMVDPEGIARIIDNDGSDVVPVPGVTAQNISIAENGGSARFELRLSAPQTQRVSVEWHTLDGTAEATQDYEPRAGTLRFEPGETMKTIEIPLLDDADVEEPETFVLRLSSGDARIEDAEPVCTIANDDDAAKGRRRSARH